MRCSDEFSGIVPCHAISYRVATTESFILLRFLVFNRCSGQILDAEQYDYLIDQYIDYFSIMSLSLLLDRERWESRRDSVVVWRVIHLFGVLGG